MSILFYVLLSLFFAAGNEIMNGDQADTAPTIFNKSEIRDEPQKVGKQW